MGTLFIDATVPLRWGPHPPVGIPRVESAIVRQALRQSAKAGEAKPARFFMINRHGEARFLDRRELAYLKDLVEGRAAAVESGSEQGLLARARLVLKSISAGAASTGKEFDRVSASFISGRPDRSGLAYQTAKTLVRAAKLIAAPKKPRRRAEPDPLCDANATCFISTAGLHSLATGGRGRPIAATLATVLHDIIPLTHPDLVDRSHAAHFSRDVAWMFEHCARIIAVSAHSAETAGRFAAEQGLATPGISVSRLGSFLRAGLCQRPTQPVDALAGKPFALYCSTIEIRKNHIMLLKTWVRLIPLLGDRLPKLVFCGRWGWMNEEVEAYLAAHPELADHLVVLSDLSDAELGWLYTQAAFGLYPSRAEGWGLGAAESLDFGLPVFISNAPSLMEATQGLMPVIGMDDADGWAEAVTRAVEEPDRLIELKERIRLGYLPISEQQFANRVLSLVAGEAATPARTAAITAAPATSLPRMVPWRPIRNRAETSRTGRLAGA